MDHSKHLCGKYCGLGGITLGDAQQEANASKAPDDTLSFSAAMALPPEEVEVLWVSNIDPAKNDWRPLVKHQDHVALSSLRLFRFRRSRPKRSLVQELFCNGESPCPPEETATKAIRAVVDHLRSQTGYQAAQNIASDIERHFLESR